MIHGRPFVQRVRFSQGYQPKKIVIPELTVSNALSVGSDFAALQNASFNVTHRPNYFIPAIAEWSTINSTRPI